MKRTILIKIGPNIHVNHLYEHLFCMKMIKDLNDLGLLRYIDYDYDARSYHGGFVWLNITNYSSKTNEIDEYIKSIKVDINEKSITTALNQIAAEKLEIATIDKDYVVSKIKDMNEMAWSDINSFKYFNDKSIKRTSKGFYLSKIPKSRIRILQVGAEINKNINKADYYVSIFDVIANRVVGILAEGIIDKFGYYPVESKTVSSSDTAKIYETLHLVKDPNVPFRLDNIMHECIGHSRLVSTNGLLDKIYIFLQNANYEILHSSPDPLAIYENTGLLIGSLGWKNMATKDNIYSVLNSMNIYIKFGNEKIIFPFTES